MKLWRILMVAVLAFSAPALAAFSTEKVMFTAGGAASAPVLVSSPVASGYVIIGATLSCSTGSWAATPSPTFAYKWRLNSVDISGATSNMLLVDGSNVAGPIDCYVTATNSAGSASSASNSLTTWTPASLASIQGWYDASDTSTITGGATVTQWNDKSGHGNNATQPTGSRSFSSGTRTVNGLNVMDSVGVQRGMFLPSDLYTLPSGNNTLVVAYVRDNSARGDTIRSNTFFGMFVENTAVIYAFNNTVYAPSRFPSSGSGVVDTNPHVMGQWRSGASVRAFKDGSPYGSTALAANNSSVTALAIGDKGDLVFGLDGAYLEVILCNSALSDADKNAVGLWLKNRWGITWTNF